MKQLSTEPESDERMEVGGTQNKPITMRLDVGDKHSINRSGYIRVREKWMRLPG